MKNATVTIRGNLGADPEYRVLESGSAVATLRVAVTDRKKVEGRWVDDGTTWYAVSAWDKLGEFCTDLLSKGMPVLVSGTLKLDEWTGRDGVTRQVPSITAEEVSLPIHRIGWDERIRSALSTGGAQIAESLPTPAPTGGQADERPF